MFQQLNREEGITIILVTHDAGGRRPRQALDPHPRRADRGRRVRRARAPTTPAAAAEAAMGVTPMRIVRTLKTAVRACAAT